MAIGLIWDIYCIYNDFNDKLYVGQSLYDIEKRLQSHIRQCSSRISNNENGLEYAMYHHNANEFHTKLLEECEDELMNERERYWIEKLNTFRPNGYNLTKGGSKLSNNQKEKVLTLWQQGLSIKEIKEKTNLTNTTVSDILKAANVPNEHIHQRGIEQNRLSNVGQNRIYRYDIEGNYLDEWLSRSTVKEVFGISNVNMCCRGVVKTSGGFRWSYEKVDKLPPLDSSARPNKGIKRAVLQIDKDTNKIIAEFETAQDAGEILFNNRKNGSNINSACQGKIKTAYGFKWAYKENLVTGN